MPKILKEKKKEKTKSLAQQRKEKMDKLDGIKDNSMVSISDGLAKRIMDARNKDSRTIVTASTSRIQLSEIIQEYFRDLEDLPVVYTKNQMKQDLIGLLKSGTSGVAVVLADMMGFNNVNEDFEIHTINYADVPDEHCEYASIIQDDSSSDDDDDD